MCEAMCETGKVRYHTPQEAWSVCQRVNQRKRKTKNDSGVYRCPFCGDYHLSASSVIRKYIQKKNRRLSCGTS